MKDSVRTFVYLLADAAWLGAGVYLLASSLGLAYLGLTYDGPAGRTGALFLGNLSALAVLVGIGCLRELRDRRRLQRDYRITFGRPLPDRGDLFERLTDRLGVRR
jgi:hypothetical protein